MRSALFQETVKTVQARTNFIVNPGINTGLNKLSSKSVNRFNGI